MVVVTRKYPVFGAVTGKRSYKDIAAKKQQGPPDSPAVDFSPSAK